MTELYILLAGLAISFVSVIIIMTKRPSEAQKWYLLATAAIFVYMAANYVRRHSGERDTYLYLQSAIYGATAVFNGCFLFGMVAALEIRVRPAVRRIFAWFIISSCLLVMTIHMHPYFYSEVKLSPNPAAPGLYVSDTTENWLYYGYIRFFQYVKIIVSLYLMIRFLRKRGNKPRMFRLLALALLTPVIVNRLSIFDFLPSSITNHCSYIATNIIILVLIQYYDVTMTLPVIKEQAIEQSQDGIVILDRNRYFQYANDSARSLFPALASENPDDAMALISNGLRTETITCGGNTKSGPTRRRTPPAAQTAT